MHLHSFNHVMTAVSTNLQMACRIENQHNHLENNCIRKHCIDCTASQDTKLQEQHVEAVQQDAGLDNLIPAQKNCFNCASGSNAPY